MFLDAEFDALFEAASFEDEAPYPATHTGTKTVHAGTMTGFWLVCSFWHSCLLRLPVACGCTFRSKTSAAHFSVQILRTLTFTARFSLRTALPTCNLSLLVSNYRLLTLCFLRKCLFIEPFPDVV